MDAALSAGEKADLKLHVCDEAFALSEAQVSTSATGTSYLWNNAGVDWSETPTRRLVLTMPGDARVSSRCVYNQVPVMTPPDGFIRSYQRCRDIGPFGARVRLRAERSYLFRLRAANDKEMWLEHGDRSNIAYQGATGIDDATIIYTPKRSGEILVCTNGAPDLDVMRLADEREMTERNDCRDSDDPHDGPNCGIENQGLVRGRIGSPSDSDLWSVILARGHTYEFRVRGAGDDAGDNGGTLEDPQVELYEMSWMQATGWTRTKVAANDNVSTSNKNSVVTYVYPDLDEPQSPFWVAVRGANGTTGTYTLTVKGSPMTVGSGTVLIGNIQRLAGGGLVPRRYHGAVFTTGGKAAGYLPTQDCADAGAVCTADGTRLSTGPPSCRARRACRLPMRRCRRGRARHSTSL